MKEKTLRLLLSLTLAVALHIACASPGFAEENEGDDSVEQLCVVLDSTGTRLFTFCGTLHEGDEYIAQDNVLYRIGSIEKRFGIDLGQFGTRERLISCYRYKILTSNKFRQLLV